MGAAKREAAEEKRRQIARAEAVARDRHLRSVGVHPTNSPTGPRVALAPEKSTPPIHIAPLPDTRWQRFKPPSVAPSSTPETFHIAFTPDGVSVHNDGLSRGCPDALHAAEWILAIADLPHGWAPALAWELRERKHWVLNDTDLIEWGRARE